MLILSFPLLFNSLDWKEGPVKKNSLFVCLFVCLSVCLCQVKRTSISEFSRKVFLGVFRYSRAACGLRGGRGCTGWPHGVKGTSVSEFSRKVFLGVFRYSRVAYGLRWGRRCTGWPHGVKGTSVSEFSRKVPSTERRVLWKEIVCLSVCLFVCVRSK